MFGSSGREGVTGGVAPAGQLIALVGKGQPVRIVHPLVGITHPGIQGMNSGPNGSGKETGGEVIRLAVVLIDQTAMLVGGIQTGRDVRGELARDFPARFVSFCGIPARRIVFAQSGCGTVTKSGHSSLRLPCDTAGR